MTQSADFSDAPLMVASFRRYSTKRRRRLRKPKCGRLAHIRNNSRAVMCARGTLGNRALWSSHDRLREITLFDALPELLPSQRAASSSKVFE